MRLEIVQDENVPIIQPLEQLTAQPVHKSLGIGGVEYRAHQHPTTQAHRPKTREVVAPIHWNPLNVFETFFCPDVTPGHCCVQPRFVEEN
jgi:hypothetical protein